MADSLPLSLKRTQFFNCGIAILAFGKSRQFSYYFAFCLKVRTFGAALAGTRFFLLFKESITCGCETLPERIAVLFRNSTYSLPLFLHLDKCIGCGIPVGTVLESLGLVGQFLLACEITRQFLTCAAEIIGFGSKEFVTGRTEAIEQLSVRFLRGKSYSLPFFLKPYDCFRHSIPVGKRTQSREVKSFKALAKHRLGGLVLSFFRFTGFKIRLIALVDFS